MTQITALPVNSVAPNDWWRRVSTTVNTMLGLVTDLYRRPSAAVTADYAVSTTDYAIIVDASAGPITVTLPAAAEGRQLVAKKIDASANAVTLAGQVDGATSTTLGTQWQSFTLLGGQDRWYIV